MIKEDPIKCPTYKVDESISWVKPRFERYDFKMPTLLSRLGIEKYEMWSNVETQVEVCVARFLSREAKDELDILIKVFALSGMEKRNVIQKIFSVEEIEQLIHMNILLPVGSEMLSCEIALSECEGLLIATDSLTKIHPGINRVMPLLAEVYEFSSARVKSHVKDTLDLCSGSGIHGFLASRHSDRVICVDNNPRAIAFSKFNRALNGISNVEIVEGDLFSRLEGKRFDLILANPPYVPTGDSKPGENHYSGGPRGDALSSRIVQGLPLYLKDNGLCQMIHLMVLFGSEGLESWLRSHLSDYEKQFSFVVSSRPAMLMGTIVDGASSVEWGVTSIKRAVGTGGSFYRQLPYTFPLRFNIEQLFSEGIHQIGAERGDLCSSET